MSEKRQQAPNAHIVVYLASTHNRGRRFPERRRQSPVGADGLPKAAKKGSIYAMFSMEQPMYATVLQNLKDLDNNFDLMVTYSWKNKYPGTSVSNLPVTYFPLNIVSPEEVLKGSTLATYDQRTGFGTGVSTVIFISNCKAAGAAQRLKYVQELMNLLPIHSYGSCLNNREEPEYPNDPAWPNQRRARKVKILSQYKFYLAFENLAVDYYVSEKVFEGLFSGAVPIYRGASQIDEFMPSSMAYINANNMSPKDLGAKLKYLAKPENKKEYEAYLSFKSQPLSQKFLDMSQKSYSHPNVLCRLCEYAANATGTF